MTEKIKLMFDATILANAASKNAARSGIFFTAYQISKSLINNPELEIAFYGSTETQLLLKKLPEFKHVSFYPYITIFDIWNFHIRKKKQEAKKDHKWIKKTFWHWLLLLSRILFLLPNIFLKKCCMKNKFLPQNFLSPTHAYPKKLNKNAYPHKYIILYDAIPLLYPEYYPDIQKGEYWLLDVINQLKSDPSTHAFAISEQTRKDFLKFIPELSPDRISVTPLACSDSFHPCSKEQTIKSLKKYNLPTNKRYVFSLCSLEPRKNLIRAVKTFIEFIKKNSIDDMVFILGGGHWEEFIGKLDSEIEGLGAYKNKVIKAGYIDDEDLAPLYSGAEWFVYTSQYEGFGLPPLEAMACGCPVITSNNSSLPEVVAGTGIMIDWDSDEQHIKAYEDYYYHPKLREEMRQKGLVRAKEFSWNKTADLIIKDIKRNTQ